MHTHLAWLGGEPGLAATGQRHWAGRPIRLHA